MNEGSENWEGVRTNTLLMILGDLARANEDMSDDDIQPYYWELDRDALIREIERHGRWMQYMKSSAESKA